MQTVRVLEKAGMDGMLHLRIPVGQPEVEFEAVILLQPKPTATQTPPDERGWPSQNFDTTFGSIDDESCVRQSQGELPPALEFD